MTNASTEGQHPLAAGLQDHSAPEILARLHAGQSHAVAVVAAAIPALAEAAAAAAASLAAGCRLAYAGAGSSGLMALADALELAGTYGIPATRTPVLFAGGAAALLALRGAAEDDPRLAAADLAGLELGPGDTLVAVSASGFTPYTLAVAEGARAAGAVVIGIANVAGSALLERATIAVLLDTGPELVAGSTRMGAGTAQKIALNMMSTLTGLLLGHIHDGYMVNVVADNAKLRDRAARIVAAIACASEPAARAALEITGGAVKPAVLVAAGASRDAAETLLASSNGHIAPALDALQAGR